MVLEQGSIRKDWITIIVPSLGSFFSLDVFWFPKASVTHMSLRPRGLVTQTKTSSFQLNVPNGWWFCWLPSANFPRQKGIGFMWSKIFSWPTSSVGVQRWIPFCCRFFHKLGPFQISQQKQLLCHFRPATHEPSRTNFRVLATDNQPPRCTHKRTYFLLYKNPCR